eukprot:1137056-Pelagomonas_calceolata.AAC.10
MRAERKFKRPKPGRTRLVKWPRTLLRVKVCVCVSVCARAHALVRARACASKRMLVLICMKAPTACAHTRTPNEYSGELNATESLILLTILGNEQQGLGKHCSELHGCLHAHLTCGHFNSSVKA